jgi:hypothetical protein
LTNQSVWPVGTGPDGAAAPETAFWMISFGSSAIRSACRTRMSSNGLRLVFTWATVSQAFGLSTTVTFLSALTRSAPSWLRKA